MLSIKNTNSNNVSFVTSKCLKFMKKSVMETGEMICDKGHHQGLYWEVFLETGHLNPGSKQKVLWAGGSMVGIRWTREGGDMLVNRTEE